jgi:hypothetical protein
MPIVDKREELEKVDSIPLRCVQCGFETRLLKPSREVLGALYEVSSLHESEHELALLQRTKALFDRFPHSRHPQKVCKQFLSNEERPKMGSDPEFDQALDAEPELKTFLDRSSFYLPARIQGVTKWMEKQGQPDLHLIGCTHCGSGHFCIEPKFFESLFQNVTTSHWGDAPLELD